MTLLKNYPKGERPRRKTFDPDRGPRGPVYVQVHFSGLPGATKKHLHAIKREITEKVQDMTRRGQLILSGRYLSSIGGVWLLKVKTFEEAQRLAKEHPGVKSNLLTYRCYILVENMGMVTRREIEHQPAIPRVEAE
ncbi:hypothetical protein KKH18_06610 [bacterium]|nr:hypothetical protein [bacterium]